MRDANIPRQWTFLTNHAQVLLAVAQKPGLRVRQIAAAAEITERYAYEILHDLEKGGYVERRRSGRCNLYRIHPELRLGDPVVEEQTLRELLQLTGNGKSDADVMAMSASVHRANRYSPGGRRRASGPRLHKTTR